MIVMKLIKSSIREHEEGFIIDNVFLINGVKHKKSSYFTEQELNDN